LWVVEPPSVVVEDPPVKRILAYPINVQASVVHLPDDPTQNFPMETAAVMIVGTIVQRDGDAASLLLRRGSGGSRCTPAQEPVGPSTSSVLHDVVAAAVVISEPVAASHSSVEDVRDVTATVFGKRLVRVMKQRPTVGKVLIAVQACRLLRLCRIQRLI
jgi:hypothetical protein